MSSNIIRSSGHHLYDQSLSWHGRTPCPVNSHLLVLCLYYLFVPIAVKALHCANVTLTDMTILLHSLHRSWPVLFWSQSWPVINTSQNVTLLFLISYRRILGSTHHWGWVPIRYAIKHILLSLYRYVVSYRCYHILSHTWGHCLNRYLRLLSTSIQDGNLQLIVLLFIL
jgi:hypothetical protein